MRIFNTNTSTAVNGAPAKRRAPSAGGFAVATEEVAQQPSAGTAALRTIGGIDALIALQGEDGPAGRRQRAVRRGRVALDALDDLKPGLLAGTLGQATLLRLKSAAGELKGDSGEPGLDAVLAEIELRVAVEIAKLTPR
jgi:Class II flagellar assembly regulator